MSTDLLRKALSGLVECLVTDKAPEQACHSANKHDNIDLIIALNQNNVRHFGRGELAIRTIVTRSASFAMRHEFPPALAKRVTAQRVTGLCGISDS